MLTKSEYELTEEEERIIRVIRKMESGEIAIRVKDDKPYLVEEKRT